MVCLEMFTLQKEMVTFYSRCIEYIKMCEGNFREVETFSWINENVIKWPAVEKTAELVNTKVAGV